MEEIQTDVNQVPAPSPETPVKPVEADKPVTQKPPEGYVPYQALYEERQLRKELQDKLDKLSATPEVSGDVFSDEGKALKAEISELNTKLSTIEKREQRREAEVEFPFLKDMKNEFDSFLEDDENKRLSIKKAAKLFALEKGLIENEPTRKGLEKQTGGGQVPSEPTYTADEVQYMMKNDWKKYEKLVRSGKI